MSKEKMTFEESVTELENISKRLESDKLSLEEAIELFEKGIKLSNECANTLNSAKQRIEKITDLENSLND